MAVHGEERPWPHLPGDLLAAIYLRAASAYDRARFAAVCSLWRAVAAWYPRLPALPLLLPSTLDRNRTREARAYSPEDGRALRVPLPWFESGNWLVGSHDGGWIATESCSSDELLVVNLFTGTRAVHITKPFTVDKIVFSKDPLSVECLMAAMTTRCTVALYRAGCPEGGWTMKFCDKGMHGDLADIAFCNGELYGVTTDQLIVFDTRMDKEGPPVTIWVFRAVVGMSWSDTAVKYIFQLHGKLAVAVGVELRHGSTKFSQFFRVFEFAKRGDAATPHTYKWSEVKNLGDHALFLGPAGSCKAVHMPPAAGRRGGVEANHIYYAKKHTYLSDKEGCLERLDMDSCSMYCCESQEKRHLENIVSRGYHYPMDHVGVNGANGCVWLWPPNF